MGAGLFGPIAAMAGMAGNIRDQGQKDALAQAMAQLKMQGMETQNQADQFNLKQAKAQEAERAKILADPNADPMLKMAISAGLPPDLVNAIKLQKQNDAAANLYAGVARLKPKGDEAAALQLAATARRAGVEPNDIKEAFAGTDYFKDPDSEETKQLRIMLEQQKLAMGPNVKPENLSWRAETDPTTGRPIQVPYKYDPVSGSMVRIPVAGDAGAAVPGKLNATQQRLVDSVNDISYQMPDLEETIAGLGPVGKVEMMKQYGKYIAPFGVGGAVDPKFAAYFNTIGQVQTDLIAAATAGGSRSFALIEYLKPHIPDPTDPPARALEKLKGFDMGRFNAIRTNLLGTGPRPGSRELEGAGGATPATTGGVSTMPIPSPVAKPSSEFVLIDRSTGKITTDPKKGTVAKYTGTVDPTTGRRIYQTGDGQRYLGDSTI